MPITTSSFDIVSRFVVINDLVESIFLVVKNKVSEQIDLRTEGLGRSYIHDGPPGGSELELRAQPLGSSFVGQTRRYGLVRIDYSRHISI